MRFDRRLTLSQHERPRRHPPLGRLLMTTDAVGGVWTYSLALAEQLSRHGVRVTLAVMGPPPSEAQLSEARRIDGLQLERESLALEWMDDPWHEVDQASEWLLDLADRVQPDIVHLNGYVHAALSWPAPVVVVAHSCVGSWFEAVLGETLPERYAEYRQRVSAGLRAAEWVVAPTRAMLRALERQYRVPLFGRVIPNGLELARFEPEPKQPYVLAAGRLWDRAKNVSLLTEIARELPWPVRVAGDSRQDDRPPAELQHVELLGRLSADAMQRQLATAAVFAHPAYYEPFGLAVLEAAASGCALVLSDIPSLRESWDGAALFASPSDPSAFRDALRRVIDDAELRKTLSGRALARCRQFTAERMASKYLDLYATLTSERPRHVWRRHSGGAALRAEASRV